MSQIDALAIFFLGGKIERPRNFEVLASPMCLAFLDLSIYIASHTVMVKEHVFIDHDLNI